MDQTIRQGSDIRPMDRQEPSSNNVDASKHLAGHICTRHKTQNHVSMLSDAIV